jgi:DNA primase
MSPRDDRVLLPLGLRTPRSFAPTLVVASQEGVEQCPDRLALVVGQELGGLEGQTQALVVAQPVVLAKDQEICRRGQRNSQLRDDAEGRLIGPEFIATELAHMDAGPFSQCSLGQSPLASQCSQSLGELHVPHATKLGIVDTIYIVYNQDNLATSDQGTEESANESGGPVGSSMKMRAVPDDVVAFEVDASDHQAVLSGVLDHYAEHLLMSSEAQSRLARFSCTEAQAAQLRIGYSDRTLGLRLPDRQWKAGRILRSALTDVGILRTSGHEAFRGCLVIPVIDAAGQIVQLYGMRVDGSGIGNWADGLPGGIFNEQPAADGVVTDSVLVIAASIEDALAVLGAGHSAVIALGRPRGFTRRDLAGIAKAHHDVVVLGSGHGDVATRLSALGVSVRVAGHTAPIAGLLGSATAPVAALAALLATAKFVTPDLSAVATVDAGETDAAVITSAPEPTAPTSASTDVIGPPALDVHEIDGDVFVTSPARSWRIRGAQSGDSDGAQMLRVALSVTDTRSDRFHLDTLDLYSARQRTAFLSAAVTELHTAIETLRPEMARVIAAAEMAHDREAEPEDPLPEMTEADRTAATELLCSPDLIGRVTADLGSLGVVGEETNLLICYLATVSRLSDRPFGVLVQSSSAAGKSTLAEAACSLVPDEDLVSLSALTTQALYYLDGGQLAHKVLAVAEEQGSHRASYALKLLVSEGRLSIASTGKDRSTGKLSTARVEIAGPVSLIMTTTAAEIDPELENRLVVLGVDENEIQTRAIQAAQRQAASFDGLVTKAARNHLRQLHRNAQRLLASFPVVVPAFEVEFPATAPRHRRDHAKLMSIITAVTLLHQHQREVLSTEIAGTEVTYLQASEADVALGIALAAQVLMRDGDRLSPACRQVLDAVECHVASPPDGTGIPPLGITRRQIREQLGWSDKTVRAATDRLVALEYLVAGSGGRGRLRTYHLVAPIGPVGPTSDPVGPMNGPVRPEGGQTRDPCSPGQSDQLAQLAHFERAPMQGEEIVERAVVVVDGESDDQATQGTP